MFTNYEIARAMLELGRTERQSGERFHRNWDVVEWANHNLTEAEQHMCSRLVEDLQ